MSHAESHGTRGNTGTLLESRAAATMERRNAGCTWSRLLKRSSTDGAKAMRRGRAVLLASGPVCTPGTASGTCGNCDHGNGNGKQCPCHTEPVTQASVTPRTQSRHAQKQCAFSGLPAPRGYSSRQHLIVLHSVASR